MQYNNTPLRRRILTGTLPNDRPPSKQRVGKHNNPATLAIVHGVGQSAISFPPTLTINTSFDDILSRINLSCDRNE